MGRVLTRLLKSLDYGVTVCSRSESKARGVADSVTVEAAGLGGVSEAETVLVSVPIEVTSEVCLAVADMMRSGSLLVDVTSVKTPVVEAVSRDLPGGLEYLSIHPLFGPRVRGFQGENVLAVKAVSGQVSEKFLNSLTEAGLNVTVVSAFQHDRAMAAYQVLHHFALLSLGMALGENLGSEGLNPMLYTRSFKSTLKTLKKMRGMLKTILEIQRFNPHAPSVRRNLVEVSSKHVEMNKDVEDVMNRALRILDYA